MEAASPTTAETVLKLSCEPPSPKLKFGHHLASNPEFIPQTNQFDTVVDCAILAS